MDAAAIFQRTDEGRAEIQNKKHGLTQSERLVLIILDGVTNYGNLRAKLKGLSDERFDRALKNLMKKELVIEVMFQPEHLKPEKLDATVVDRFLQQDPLDPVTIISFDPDEDVDLEEESTPTALGDSPITPIKDELKLEEKSETAVIEPELQEAANASQVRGRITKVDIYLPLDKNMILAPQQPVSTPVVPRQPAMPAKQADSAHAQRAVHAPRKSASLRPAKPPRTKYWIFFIILIVIALGVFAFIKR